MSGPSTKRVDLPPGAPTGNTSSAPLPGLTNPYQNLLLQLLGGTNTGTSGMFGSLGNDLAKITGGQSGNPLLQHLFVNQQPSALQTQTGNTFSQLLNGPTAQQRTFETALPQIQGLLGQLQTGYGDILKQSSPQGILDASQPIFQRNLQLAADTLRQAGPRFNSNTERLVGQYGEQSLQDYNLFAQQAIQNAMQTRLGALGGLATGTYGGFNTLGSLGQGADASVLNNLMGAGSFANQMAGQNLQAGVANQGTSLGILQLIGGLASGNPIYQQSPGSYSNIMNTVGTLGALGISAFGQGGPFGAGGRWGPQPTYGAPAPGVPYPPYFNG